MPSTLANAIAVLAIFTSPAIAHSWVEQLVTIKPDGTFSDNIGYIRGNVKRSDPGFGDPALVHILPGLGETEKRKRQAPSPNDVQGITKEMKMCHKSQRKAVQSSSSPRLKAAAGDLVSLRYQENGHVTLPKAQPGKQPKGGLVYVYGTTQPKDDESFLDVFMQWTADGSGGDKRGRLLATQPYDDGVCYQVNGGEISTERQKKFSHPADKLTGGDIWCQNNIKIPTEAPSGKPYTIYWVWDWPTLPNVDPGLPKGKAEIYTSCMDIDITGTKASRDLEDRQAPSSGSNPANMAIGDYMKQINNGASGAAAPSPAPASAPAKLAVAPVASSPAPVAPVAPAPVASSPAAPVAPAPAAPKVSSLPPVAPAPAAPVVAKPSVVTVTVTAPAPPQPTTMVTKASVQPAPAANSMPPSSLQVAAPIMSAPAFEGTASPLASSADASLPTFAGTATPIAPSAMPTATDASIMPSSTAQCNCRKQKRSNIFGH